MSNSALQNTPITIEDLLECTRVFEAVATDSLLLGVLSEEQRIRLLMAAGQVIRPHKDEVKRRVRVLQRERSEARREANRSARGTTTIRAARQRSIFIPPQPLLISTDQVQGKSPELQSPDFCYICKDSFTKMHHFYDSLCPACADFNYEKRYQTYALSGRVALITGARLKIGYQAALMMLRAGAQVIVTTRFPIDAAKRYANEEDFAKWGDKLDIYGLDLRHSPSVEAFTRYVDQSYKRLDFLINNAAQTVRRPPGFYKHMLETEAVELKSLPAAIQPLLKHYDQCKIALSTQAAEKNQSVDGTAWVADWHKGKAPLALGLIAATELSQIPYNCDDPAALDPALFPQGKLDADLQQVDLRRMNSWRMTLADVPTAELLEVQLINSIAPFILCSKLKPLMIREKTNDKHIVNVSAMEGKFARHTKTEKHPHTNMAKAALNMMTLTSARDYVKDGIFMNAVDTGWVTDEDPAEHVARKQIEQDFQPPLDIVDGAARVLDPIFSGLRSGKHSWGNFLKDYRPTEW